jgi:aromatic-L-amino-acid decarboxylase
MNWEDFARWGRRIADWGAAYHKGLRDRPVRAQVKPGDLLGRLPQSPPETGEPMDAIFADFENLVLPGMTHWQHPRFFAYFPANAAPPSVLAEYIVSTMAAQCMLWQTSPAATEMETRMLDWLRQAVGLPDTFTGVIQDSASSATLAAVLTMREKALGWDGNKKGLFDQPRLRIYASGEVHTSVDRAMWVSGIGEDNLIRIPVEGNRRGMQPEALRKAISADLQAGFKPAGIILSTGGTSIGGSDDIAACIEVAKGFDLYTHLDAAWAGAAMIVPEFRDLWQGVDGVDSMVFNPHKWLGAQFDCSAHFLKNPDDLVRTLAIRPEFLKTHGHDGMINYSEWSVPLGRRFRALKLWFLIRSYGLEDLRQRIRNHVTWSRALAERLRAEPDFEIITEPVLSLFSFRYAPNGATDLDALNQRLVDAINDDGRIYITQTLFEGKKVIRFQVGQFDCTEADVATAFDVITEIARSLETQ